MRPYSLFLALACWLFACGGETQLAQGEPGGVGGPGHSATTGGGNGGAGGAADGNGVSGASGGGGRNNYCPNGTTFFDMTWRGTGFPVPDGTSVYAAITSGYMVSLVQWRMTRTIQGAFELAIGSEGSPSESSQCSVNGPVSGTSVLYVDVDGSGNCSRDIDYIYATSIGSIKYVTPTSGPPQELFSMDIDGVCGARSDAGMRDDGATKDAASDGTDALSDGRDASTVASLYAKDGSRGDAP